VVDMPYDAPCDGVMEGLVQVTDERVAGGSVRFHRSWMRGGVDLVGLEAVWTLTLTLGQ
jgi:hypothetical protein